MQCFKKVFFTSIFVIDYLHFAVNMLPFLFYLCHHDIITVGYNEAWELNNTTTDKKGRQLIPDWLHSEITFILVCKKVEGTKGIMKKRKSKTDIYYNDHKKKDKRTNNDMQNITQKTKDWATRNPFKPCLEESVILREQTLTLLSIWLGTPVYTLCIFNLYAVS
jgi:hypothetical protein